MWIVTVLFFFLLICTITDCRKREIPFIIVCIGIFTAFILHVAGMISWTNPIAIGTAAIPGGFFWILSFVSKEKVGYGDGWLLLMIGMFVGYERCILTLMFALVLESLVALPLLVMHRIKKDGELAFAPFLLIGVGITAWL